MTNSKSEEAEAYRRRVEDWEKAKFAPPPEAPLNPREPNYVVMMLMRDGVKLYTEVFLPLAVDTQVAQVPAILIRSPYPFSRPSRNDRLPITRFLEAGYAVVFQLTRGQGSSEGMFSFLKSDVDDGYDTVQWVAEQDWCDGSVGMHGSSYSGSAQLLAARAAPPALKCIMPTAFVGNFTTCFPFSYGVPMKAHYLQWHTVADAESWEDMDAPYGETLNILVHKKWGPALRHRPLVDAANEVLSGDKLVSWRDTISHPKDDEFWASVHFTDDELEAIQIPMFFTDGWYDSTIGPIEFFQRLKRRQPNRDNIFLLVGPWNHFQTASVTQPGEDDGDRVLPNKGSHDIVEQSLAFFDRYLKGKEHVSVQEDSVRVFITDSKGVDGGIWMTFPTFPAPGVKFKKLFLHSDGDAAVFPGGGKLNWYPPKDEPTDQYIYDPQVPTYFETGTSTDRRQLEVRSDVLTFTSDAVIKDLTILGDINLVLYASSDAPDTDWFAMITEVFPDGVSKSFHYAPPGFRARYRNGQDCETFMVPGEPTDFVIPMGPAGHKIAAGNRIRLSIFSSAFPEFDQNTNTGAEASIDTRSRIAKQTIFHDSERSSHLILPLLKD